MTGKSAATSTTTTPSVDGSLAGRLERLVNNEQFADVAFRVGEDPGEVMFGHKAILTEASEVFRAQFSGMFKESRENVKEHEIPVVDIEPDTFRELLRYMYCERVNVTADNVVDVSYGSKKYLLTKLNKICEKFIQRNVTEDNVLRVFDSNRRYELEGVNRICLDIICDNPIKIFADELFLTLTRKSVELIASRQAINCQKDQLVSAIEQWLQVNEDESEDGTKLLTMVQNQKDRGVMCKKMHNFAAGHYVSSNGFSNPAPAVPAAVPAQRPTFSFAAAPLANPLAVSTTTPASPFGSVSSPTQKTFILKIETDKPCSIYGVGIYIKSKQFHQTVSMEINVQTRKMPCKNSLLSPAKLLVQPTSKRTVTAKEDLCVEQVLFRKHSIEVGETCKITIQMNHGITPLFCLKNFEPEQPEVGLRFTCSNAMDPLLAGGQSTTNSCVAYVLYNLDQQPTTSSKA